MSETQLHFRSDDREIFATYPSIQPLAQHSPHILSQTIYCVSKYQCHRSLEKVGLYLRDHLKGKVDNYSEDSPDERPFS